MFGIRRADTFVTVKHGLFLRRAMKKMILSGLAGLLSVGLIAGCGMMRNSHDECSTGRCRQGLAQKPTAGATVQARAGVSWWSKTKAPAVGTESVIIGAPSIESAPVSVAPPRLPGV